MASHLLSRTTYHLKPSVLLGRFILKSEGPGPHAPQPCRSLKSIAFKASRKSTANSTDDGQRSVIAYNLSEELKIDHVHKFLENFKDDYQINTLPDDIQDEAVMLSSKRIETKPGNSIRSPMNDIFLFREGSVVFWGVPYDKQRHILYGLSSLKVNPNASKLIQEEREHMSYSLSDDIEKSKIVRDTIQLSARQDLESQKLDQFASSHAIALSVRLGILEMTLDEYIKSVEWITDDMATGKKLKITRDQVFRKTGEILGLKHSINLSSDLLDLPDIYWDRQNQEELFLSLSTHLNIKKRTSVINEKLNNCCELMNLLANHMNDNHHTRLEWMIIVLITVEVLFEVSRFV